MKKVVIFGNTRWAELVNFCITEDSFFEVAGFTVDPQYIHNPTFAGLPVAPFDTVEQIFPPTEYAMLIALSYQQMNKLRRDKYLQAKSKGYELVSYVSSRSTTWPDLALGENCLIIDACVNPLVTVGNNVSIGANAMIGHHAVLMDHCFISPGAVLLGSVTVGPSSLVGANATIREGVTIAPECLIGSGVTITSNTLEKGVYLGRSPQLLPKGSDRLTTWLTWSVPKGGTTRKAPRST